MCPTSLSPSAQRGDASSNGVWEDQHAPQALHVVLPSASLLQSGVVLVPQLTQTMPPVAVAIEADIAGALAFWPTDELLSAGQPAHPVLPPVPLQ